jgi:hypothetical protein
MLASAIDVEIAIGIALYAGPKTTSKLFWYFSLIF